VAIANCKGRTVPKASPALVRANEVALDWTMSDERRRAMSMLRHFSVEARTIKTFSKTSFAKAIPLTFSTCCNVKRRSIFPILKRTAINTTLSTKDATSRNKRRMLIV